MTDRALTYLTSFLLAYLFDVQFLQVAGIPNKDLILGFLSPKFFHYESFYYGLLANACYSIIIIFRGILSMAENEMVKPFNKYQWVLIIARPFGAGVVSFVLTPLLIAISYLKKEWFTEAIESEVSLLIIGLIFGFFFEWFIKKEFLDKIFNKLPV